MLKHSKWAVVETPSWCWNPLDTMSYPCQATRIISSPKGWHCSAPQVPQIEFCRWFAYATPCFLSALNPGWAGLSEWFIDQLLSGSDVQIRCFLVVSFWSVASLNSDSFRFNQIYLGSDSSRFRFSFRFNRSSCPKASPLEAGLSTNQKCLPSAQQATVVLGQVVTSVVQLPRHCLISAMKYSVTPSHFCDVPIYLYK